MNTNVNAKPVPPSVEEMNLSDRETVAFQRILQTDPCSAEEIMTALEFSGVGAKDMSSVIVLVKYLSAKVAPFGYIIQRISTIGRGKKAMFTIEKKF